MYGDGNPQHQHEPVWIRMLHAAAHCGSDVIRHLHSGQAKPQPGGVYSTTGQGLTLVVHVAAVRGFYFYRPTWRAQLAPSQK